MISKPIFIVIALVVLIGSIATFIFSKSNRTSKETAVVPTTTPTPTPVTLLTWVDEAGFSFQYPEGTTVDKHPEDTKNYANLPSLFPPET